MIELVPLCSATIELGGSHPVGVGPAGDRTVGELRSVNVTGERLNATLVAPVGADWMVRTGSIAIVDVRMLLRTQDDALIYLSYRGRLDLGKRDEGLFAYVAPVFETGDPRYAWLNGVQAVGKGEIIIDAAGGRIEYEFFEIR